jgi:hypothetical protein
MNAVFFASWMPYIHRADIYIDCLKTYFSDCDIYVGINPSQFTNEWKTKLETSGLNIKTVVVPDNKVINSDASAFEEALKLYKSCGLKNYKYCYFLHSKGASYPNDQQWSISCREYFIRYCKEFSKLSTLFLDTNPTYGGWCPFGQVHLNYKDLTNIKNEFQIMTHKTISYELMETIYFITHYTIRGNIINQFLCDANLELMNPNRYRYYFEVNFAFVVDFYGYIRHINDYWNSDKYSPEYKQNIINKFKERINVKS